MKLWAIDGNRLHLDGGAMFGNAPKAMWKKWTAYDQENRIPLASRALLVQTEEGRNILFEAGTGAFFDPESKSRFGVESEESVLIKNLEKAGFSEKDIDVVVLSHLHFDHAGGLLPAYGEEERLHFPKAKYYLAKKHWEYAKRPHIRERASFIPILQELLAQSNRLVLIERREHPDLNFGVHFYFSEGHTIGLMLSEVATEEGPLVFVTDLIPGNAWVHLPLTMGYDRFPEKKVDEKLELYKALGTGEKGANKARLFFTHDPEIACVYLNQDEKGRYFGEVTQL